MGDKNTIIGIVVCFFAIVLYVVVVKPLLESERVAPTPQQARPRPIGPSHIGASHPRPHPTTQPAATTQPARAGTEIIPDLPLQDLHYDILCETSLLRVVLSNRGAALREVTLRDYHTFPGKDERLRFPLLAEIEKDKLSLTMSAMTEDAPDLDSRGWELVPAAEVPKFDGFTQAVRFRTRLPRLGLEIHKTFLFREPWLSKGSAKPVGGRDVQLQIDVWNLGTQDITFRYKLRSAAGIVPEPSGAPLHPDNPELERRLLEQSSSRDVAAVIGVRSGDKGASLDTYSPGKVQGKTSYRASVSGQAVYAGVQNRYFAAVVEPLTSRAEITGVVLEPVGPSNVTATAEIVSEVIKAKGPPSSKRFLFFVGPRKPDTLREYGGHDFDALLNYGWLAPVTRFLTWLLATLRFVTPNYGWAIILMTALVRLTLLPLSLKTQQSQQRMQKIQPLLNAMKEKYKNDKLAQHREMTRVMRENKVHPLGGCLPMLLQLPILFALWRALYQDVSLRHAPFLLWIKDLSKPDNLFSFGAPLPIIGSSLNLLPLLGMSVTLWQQMLTPKSEDPQVRQQQSLMRVMTVVFGFMFYTIPAGVMVYFVSSTLCAIAEQRVIQRRTRALAAKEAEQAGPVPVDQKRQRPAAPGGKQGR